MRDLTQTYFGEKSIELWQKEMIKETIHPWLDMSPDAVYGPNERIHP
jgi:hypothetical protein